MDGKNLEQQATTLRNQGRGYESIEKYTRAKESYLQEGNLARAAGCQHMIGVSYKIENDIEHAMPAYDQAIQDYRAAGDLLGPGRVHRDMGSMYEYYDQLDKAEEYLLQSKREIENTPDSAADHQAADRSHVKNAELGITIAKLGFVNTRMNKLKSAEQYITKGLSLIRNAGHPFYEITALHHLGALYFVTKQYERMLVNLEAALGLVYEYNMQAEHTRRLAQIWGLMAHAYLHYDNIETARHFTQKSFNVIDSLSETAQTPLKKDIEATTLQQKLGINFISESG